MTLLYRASENNFSALEFHKKCDNIEHTLTLIRTEFGRTIAGYTPLKWNQVASGNYAADNSGKSFLLQVDLKQKMTLTQPQNAIYCHSKYGPTFGGGHDIYVNSGGSGGYTNFGYSYNLPPGYTSGQSNTQSYLAGSYSGWVTTEIEVFQL